MCLWAVFPPWEEQTYVLVELNLQDEMEQIENLSLLLVRRPLQRGAGNAEPWGDAGPTWKW